MPQETDNLKALRARLADLRESLQSLLGEVAKSVPHIEEIAGESSGEAVRALKAFQRAGERLLEAEDAVSSRLRLLLLLGGEINSVVRTLEELRERNRRYREAFDEMWYASLPIQVAAHLDSRNLTEEEVWRKRWGSDAAAQRASTALEMTVSQGTTRGEARAERDRALLTLRYADLSLAEVGKVLDVSPPLVLARLSDLETEIVVEFLREAISSSGGDGASEAESGKGVTSVKSSIMPQRPRYSRSIEIGVRRENANGGADKSRTGLLRVVPPDDGNSPLSDKDATKAAVEVVIVYYIGEDGFWYLPASLFFEAAHTWTREAVQRHATRDFWSASSV